MLNMVRERDEIPTQSCVLAHVTTTLRCIECGAPVDLVFQSIGGTEAVNRSFSVTLGLLAEGRAAALSLNRFSVADNVMYFETGQQMRPRAGRICDASRRRGWRSGVSATGFRPRPISPFRPRMRRRDAVHAELDVAPLQAALRQAGFESHAARSACPDRRQYLLRPDLGRRLNPEDEAALRRRSSPG